MDAGNDAQQPAPGGETNFYRNLPIMVTGETFLTWVTFTFGPYKMMASRFWITRAKSLRGLELLDFVYNQVECHEYPLFFVSFEAVFRRSWTIFYMGVEDSVGLHG